MYMGVLSDKSDVKEPSDGVEEHKKNSLAENTTASSVL